METYVNANPNVNVRTGAGTNFPFIASSPWNNGTEVERDGSLVEDSSGYKWQYSIKVSNRSHKGYIRNDFLVDR